MLAKPAMKTLINRYVADAVVLMKNRRYASAIYLTGYTIELALKLKICHLLKFRHGYPETVGEFNTYRAGTTGLLSTTITDIRDMRIHDLNKLLNYSGESIAIKTHHVADWTIVSTWSAQQRYDEKVVRRLYAKTYCDAAKRILAVLT
jgi:hypothetical protein